MIIEALIFILNIIRYNIKLDSIEEMELNRLLEHLKEE